MTGYYCDPETKRCSRHEFGYRPTADACYAPTRMMNDLERLFAVRVSRRILGHRVALVNLQANVCVPGGVRATSAL
jgi:hypothetical protein